MEEKFETFQKLVSSVNELAGSLLICKMHGQKSKPNEKTHYVASTTFTLDRNYDELKAIGKGSYGVVCSGYSASLGERVAIKKITPMSKAVSDAKHVLREIKLMRHMGKHENIVTLIDLHLREVSDELYIVMELLDSDLHRILQSKQPLTEMHFKHFFHQLLSGVKYLHDNRIIHRDLKPGNLLVSKDCKLRITDFGLARERPVGKGADADTNVDEAMTEHVVTRWYRPPELMLCPDGMYDYSVDMWSCGCILAEMLGRTPLFPGKNFVHQLTLVFDVIGCPAPKDVEHIVNYEAVKFLAAQKEKKRVPFRNIFPNVTPDAWDMLDGLLLFNPTKRMTVDQGLNMAYLVGVGLPHSHFFPPIGQDFEFSFEYNAHITRYQLRQMIAAEVLSFKKELAKASKAQQNSVPTLAPEGSVHSHNSNNNNSNNSSESTSKETASGKIEAKKETTTIPVTESNKSRASSAPRLRGSGATQPAPPEPNAAPGIAERRKIPMKPPLVYQQHKKQSSQASTVENKFTSGIAQGGNSTTMTKGHTSVVSHSDVEEEGYESPPDAYDKLFKTKSTDAAISSSSGSNTQFKAPSSSVSSVMERIAKMVESDSRGSADIEKHTGSLSAASGTKSPAKSMRYNSGALSAVAEERTGYEYKSMDFDDMVKPAASSSLLHSPPRSKSSTTPSALSSGNVVSAASPGKRSILDTYLSPKRIILNRNQGKDEPSDMPKFQSFSPPKASIVSRDNETSKPQYNSMLGLFEEKFNLNKYDKEETKHSEVASSSGNVRASATSVLKSFPSPPRQSHTVVQAPTVRSSMNRGRSESKHSDSDEEDDDDAKSESSDELQHRRSGVRVQPEVKTANTSATTWTQSSRQSEHSTQRHEQLSRTYNDYINSMAERLAVDKRIVEEDVPRDSDRRSSSAAAAGLGETQQVEHAGTSQKRKFTVAKSPKFSTMSWQRRGTFGGGDVAPPEGGDKKRSTSTSGLRPNPSAANLPHAQDEDYESNIKAAAAAPPKKVPSYAQPTTSQLNKANPIRSESAHRMRK